MLVEAKHNICYDGTWYKAGDRFEVARIDMKQLAPMVYVIETPLHQEDELKRNTKPARNGKSKPQND